MNQRLLIAKRIIFLCGILSGGLAQGQTLNQIGMRMLNALTTTLNGAGIAVAQAEASLTTDYKTWEVNPVNVGQPGSLFTYASSLGTSAVYPNTLGTNSWHAEDVGNNFFGQPNGVATNVAHVKNYEANYFYATYVGVFSPPSPNATIVNQSYSFGPQTVANQQSVDSYYDNSGVQNKIISGPLRTTTAPRHLIAPISALPEPLTIASALARIPAAFITTAWGQPPIMAAANLTSPRSAA